MTDEAATAAAIWLSFGISLLFLAWALTMLLDEIKDLLIDRMERKRLKLQKKIRENSP